MEKSQVPRFGALTICFSFWISFLGGLKVLTVQYRRYQENSSKTKGAIFSFLRYAPIVVDFSGLPPFTRNDASENSVGNSFLVFYGRKLTMKRFSLLLDEDNILSSYIKKASLFKGKI